MSPQRTSEFVKAWSEYRRNGGKGSPKEFSKLWRDKVKTKTDEPAAAVETTTEVTQEPMTENF